MSAAFWPRSYTVSPLVSRRAETGFNTSNARIGGAAQESPWSSPPGPLTVFAGGHGELSKSGSFQPACTRRASKSSPP